MTERYEFPGAYRTVKPTYFSPGDGTMYEVDPTENDANMPTPEVYKVPHPEWKVVHNVDTDTVSMKPVIDVVNGRMWEIEEHILVASIIDLLRSKGYTVIEPSTDSI